MPLHLVGENIDKMRGHRQAEAGKLVQLMRGIYVDADDDIDLTVRTHAVRIAKYLYPNAYLSAASAVLLGPMRDGRLFLTGRRVQRRRIRTLEIIQNKAPDHAVIGDDMGELRVDVSSLRQRFLEAFRIRPDGPIYNVFEVLEETPNYPVPHCFSVCGCFDWWPQL